MSFLRSGVWEGKSRNYLARAITTRGNKCYAKCAGVIKAVIYHDDMKNVVEHRASRIASRA